MPESKSRIHIIKRLGGWVVKKEGAERATRRFSTKEEAISSAIEYRSKGHDLVIHRRDGTVEKWLKRHQ